ncbi:MAG: lipoate--protein ligase family protein [Limisphaerales bacterium]
MDFLDLTFGAPEENLACDEALLHWREQNGGNGILRFWESPKTFVVLGYANKIGAEVNVARCEAERIPVLRRCSGGGTVLQGAGCFNYALILPITANSALSAISGANKYIMNRNGTAIQSMAGKSLSIQARGCTDLAAAVGSPAVFRKFSGNSQRRHKAFLLFHGTFLLNFDLERIGKYLLPPSRQPDYRQGRGHRDFLMNLSFPASAVKEAMMKIWNAGTPLRAPPLDLISAMARDKYSTRQWNEKFFDL